MVITKENDAQEGNMEQRELFDQTENLFERLCTLETLTLGFKAVKANDGSPGIDRVTIKEFEARSDKELVQLRAELCNWSYKPSPVRRVEIPKPNGGVRLLGVPCIRDRVVQASLKLLLEPIFDPCFSESSYGFRPRRSQRQAIESAQKFVQAGKEHVVDIDLSKFFDTINHDRLLSQVKRKVPDSRIIKLIGLTLRSGVLANGSLTPTTEGTTQGSPLSPLLSNIVLDELDKELERRELAFCRFADDCNIFVGSKKSAERVMASVSLLLEKKMKLVVNREKSKVAISSAVKFLGMTIVLGAITISANAMDKGMEKVKELTSRRSNQSIERAIEQFNSWYRGWSGYFEMTQYPQQFALLEAHARRRFRARLVRNMKRRRTMAKMIVKDGQSTRTAKRVAYCHKSWWALSRDPAFERMFSNKWFEEQGMYIKSKETHTHWFAVKERIRFS
jgi:group II intron reverse transcriptase/maturase